MLWARMVAHVTGTVNQEVIGAMAMMIGYSMLTVNVRHSRLILGAPVVQF
jgi:hypothetical protein